MFDFAFNLLAAVTADDVFKSMNTQMAEETNPAHVLAIVAAVVGLVVLLSAFKRRADRGPKKKDASHPNRLLRQLAREAGLSRREIRELKKLALLQGVENPLTLLLCPSLMQAAIVKRKASRA